MRQNSVILLLLLFLACNNLWAQRPYQYPFTGLDQAENIQLNTITTAVPFASLTGNALQIGMADIGAVSSNFYSQGAFTGNPALLANGHRYIEIKNSYTPWLRSLVPNLDLTTGSIAGTINEHHAIGLSAKTFDYGNLSFTNQNGAFIKEYNPVEFLLQLNYAVWLNRGWSIGIAGKYINSDLTDDINVGGIDSQTGQAFAGDLGVHYRNFKPMKAGIEMAYGGGLSFNNIGNKVVYLVDQKGDFLPANMQVGLMFGPSFKVGNMRIDLDFAYQISKLLVPTPPQYATDGNGNVQVDNSGNPVIAAGKDPNVGVFQGILQSFSDAPGGTSEEFRELVHQAGSELRFVINNRFSAHLRNGFFYEDATKGGREYATVGLGGSFYGVRIDVAGIFPTTANHPLSNTFSISFGYRWTISPKEKYTTPSWSPGKERLMVIEQELNHDE